jgi:hypothetical protein
MDMVLTIEFRTLYSLGSRKETARFAGELGTAAEQPGTHYREAGSCRPKPAFSSVGHGVGASPVDAPPVCRESAAENRLL